MADALTRLEQARNPEPPVLSQWQRYELDESAWTVLAAQLYRRTMTWRQVPLQLSAEELESFGPQPPEPDYPKEPTRNSEAWLQWSLEVSRIQHAWEHQVSQWQEARQESSASWDLSPVPEWEPVSTIPPHIRPWVPVERWENAVQRAQSTVPRVETKWTSRWDPKNRRFVQIEERTSKQATVTTEQTIRRSLGARYVSLPETLVIICPTVDVPEMHRAAESGVLILTRVGFAAKDGAIQAEPVPGSELVLSTPALDIRAAACVEDPLRLPLQHYRGAHLPQSWGELDAIRGGGPDQPIRREPSASNPATSCVARSVPPQWWSLAELNCCISEAFERNMDGPFWRPVLAPRKGREQQDIGVEA